MIEIYPDDGNAYLYRGISKIKLGDQNSGCLDISKAGELGASFAYSYLRDYCH